MKIDALNMHIIRHLNDGRKSFKKIAEELAVTENTVRSRVTKLIEAGVLEVTGLVDPEKLPDHQTLIVGVRLATHDLVPRGEQFSKLRGVLSARLVTGQYDVMLEVLLNKDFSLLEFLSTELEKVSNIRSVETFVVYKGYGSKVPYIL